MPMGFTLTTLTRLVYTTPWSILGASKTKTSYYYSRHDSILSTWEWLIIVVSGKPLRLSCHAIILHTTRTPPCILSLRIIELRPWTILVTVTPITTLFHTYFQTIIHTQYNIPSITLQNQATQISYIDIHTPWQSNNIKQLKQMRKSVKLTEPGRTTHQGARQDSKNSHSEPPLVRWANFPDGGAFQLKFT